jgi:flagellar FliJ protein
MVKVAVLHKVLYVKEKEKTDAQLEEQDASTHFKRVATALYDKLKNKEDAESQLQQEVMNEPASLTKMKEQSLYITRLAKKIIALQEEVEDARKKLTNKQAILKNSYIEVKKIEKLIALRRQEQDEVNRKEDMQTMDDISLRQFVDANHNR